MKLEHLRSRRVALRWMLQCLLVFVIMLVFLFALGEIRNNLLITAIGTTSVGSSAFLAFVAHNSPMANNYRMLGGYAIAIIVGALMHVVENHLNIQLPIEMMHVTWVLAALATALSMMIMTITNSSHAPAAGLSLGMVLKLWSGWAIIIIYLAVILIAVTKTLMKPWLLNLSNDDDCERNQ